MAEEIIKHTSLSEEQKNEILDRLAFVSDQATLTTNQRKNGVLKSIFSNVSTTI